MSPEDELLIACTRQEFSLEQRLKVSALMNGLELDWDRILFAAIEHGVAPLLHMNLAQCSPGKIRVPAEIMERLQLSEVKAVALHGARAARLERLLSFLDRRSIEIMLVKGTALEILVYDRPWTTTANDIDLILNIKEDAFSDAEQAKFGALAGGYSLEYDFIVHHDITMNGILPIDFQRIWADASPVDYRSQPCFIMSAEDMMISLCINSCRKRYFRLKSLLDIAETIRRCQGIRWQLMAAKAQAYRCNYMVYTALLATQVTLGCRLPGTLRQDLALSPMRGRVIRSAIERRISQPLFGPKPSRKVLGRAVDTSLALPYLTYRWDQLLKRVWYVWRTRKRPMGLIDPDQEESITPE